MVLGLCSRVTPDSTWGPYVVLGTEPESRMARGPSKVYFHFLQALQGQTYNPSETVILMFKDTLSPGSPHTQ